MLRVGTIVPFRCHPIIIGNNCRPSFSCDAVNSRGADRSLHGSTGAALRMPTVGNLVYAVGFVPLLVASLVLAAAIVKKKRVSPAGRNRIRQDGQSAPRSSR